VLAEVSRGHTNWEFVKLQTRRFIDLKAETRHAESFMADLLAQLPLPAEVAGAICRVQLDYPVDWEPLLDEGALNEHFREALTIQVQKHRRSARRARLGDTMAVESLTPNELLDQYWQTVGLAEEETAVMQELARELLSNGQ
jgi:hypothetical protein